jgi:hypothetical protein
MKCESHEYITTVIEDMRTSIKENEKECRDLKETIIILQQNLIELSQILKELKEVNKTQDGKLDTNSAFIYKATGVLGTVSFIALILPILTWMLGSGK